MNGLSLAMPKCWWCMVTGKTEPMENLHWPLCLLSAERSSWFSKCPQKWKNGSSSPKMHPRAKLPITDYSKVLVSSFPSVDRNGNWCWPLCKNGSSSPKIHYRAKLSITDPLSPHKVWVSSFPSVEGNWKLVAAIMKKWKRLPITNALKVLVSGFLSVDVNIKLVSAIAKKWLQLSKNEL